MVIRSDNNKRIVGIIDALFISSVKNTYDNDGYLHVHLRDWKYSPSIKSHFGEYALQLNIYMHLLETYYDSIEFQVCSKRYRGIRVDSMELVVFHEYQQDYRIYTVNRLCEDLTKRIDDILAQKSIWNIGK